MKPHNQFEAFFQRFVTEFGGEVVVEPSDTKIADYVFRTQNMIAELKCLIFDQTEEMDRKVTEVVKEAVRQDERLLALCDGRPLEIAKAPKEISDPWLQILTAPLENLVRDANRQIRSTKEVLNLPSAQGVLLLFNQGNLLHNRPNDVKRLIAKVLRKKMPNGELRFTHINGVVYFSFETVKTQSQKMSFWAPMQIQTKPDEDMTQMKTFQKDLQQGWYAFVERTFGRPVRQYEGE